MPTLKKKSWTWPIMENSSNSFEICCVSKVQREAKSAFDCDKSSELDWSCKRANFPFGYFTKFTGTALLSHSCLPWCRHTWSAGCPWWGRCRACPVRHTPRHTYNSGDGSEKWGRCECNIWTFNNHRKEKRWEYWISSFSWSVLSNVGTDNNYVSFFKRKMYLVFSVLATKLVNILVFLGTNLILGESLNLDLWFAKL